MDALAKSADNLASWFSLQLDHVGHPYFQIWMIRFKLSCLAPGFFFKPQEIPLSRMVVLQVASVFC